MDAKHRHLYYKKLDCAQQKQNVSFVLGQKLFLDFQESKNGKSNAQILNAKVENLMLKI